MKRLAVLLALTTIANIAVYFFREKFQYVKHSTYAELYGACGEGCREKWNNYLLPYPEASLAEARKILAPLRLDTGTTLSKAKAIGHHLYSKFYRQAGYPQEIIHRSAPVEQYKILSADTAQKVWCGTYAQMFSFFCWSQGIVCRPVEIMRLGDRHVFNECYLPEAKRWLMVDVTNNIAALKKGDTLLNAQDFVAALSAGAPLDISPASTLQSQPFAGFAQGAGLKNYYSSRYDFIYYHVTHSAVIYSPEEKWKRYFMPCYWYEVFSQEAEPNFLFWLKPVLAALWLILAGTIVFKLLRK